MKGSDGFNSLLNQEDGFTISRPNSAQFWIHKNGIAWALGAIILGQLMF